MTEKKPTALELLKTLKGLNAQNPPPKASESQPPSLLGILDNATNGRVTETPLAGAPESIEQRLPTDKDAEIAQTAQNLTTSLEEAQAFLELHQLRKELGLLKQEYQAYRAEKQQIITDQTLKIGQLEAQLEQLTEQSLEAVQAKEDLKTQLETAKKELAELELSYKDLEETSEEGEKNLREDLSEEQNKTKDLETQLKATAAGQQRLLKNLEETRQYIADLEEDSDNMREFGQELAQKTKRAIDKIITDQNTIRDQGNQIETLTAVTNKLDEIVKQNISLQEQIQQKEGELLDKESQLTTLQREHSVYKFTQEEKTKELELQITTKQTEITLAQERATALEQDIAAYLAQIQESQGTKQDTATELERASQQLTEAREKIKSAQDEIFLLKTQNEASDKLIQDKEREFEERKKFLQNQYSALEQDRDGLKQQYETQLTDKRNKIKVLRAAITEQRNIIHKLREVERINKELAEARQTDAQQYEARIKALEQTNKYLGARIAKAVTRIFRQKSEITAQRVKHVRIRELEERLEILTADKALVDGQLTELAQERDYLRQRNENDGQSYQTTIDELTGRLLTEKRKQREKGTSFREYVLAATITIGLLAFGYQMIEYAKILTEGPAKTIDVKELIKKK